MSRTSRSLLAGLATLFLISFLWPYLTNGFFDDDALNSEVSNLLLRTGQSLIQFTSKINSDWMNGVGRFYPLGWLASFSFYYLFPTLPLARIAHIAILLSNLALGTYILARWTDLVIALFCMLVTVSLFQMRHFLDPIAGYAPMMQMFFAFMICAIFSSWTFLNEQKTKHWITACVSFAATLLIYEISLTFFPLFLLLPWTFSKNRRPTLRRSLALIIPLGLIVAVYLGFIFYLRRHRTSSYAGTELGTDWPLVLRAYQYQVGSAFPLSYLRGLHWTNWAATRDFGLHSPWIWISTCSGGGLFLLLTSQKTRIYHRRVFLLVGFGLLLLPGILIALSKRWQAELVPGVGYLPVYLSYFGLAILLTFLCHSLFDYLRRWYVGWIWGRSIAAILFMIMIFCHAATNQYVMRLRNQIFRDPRDRLTQAYEEWILKNIPEKSLFLTTEKYPWNNSDLFRGLAEKQILVQALPGMNELKKYYSETRPIFFLDMGNEETNMENKGFIFFSPIILNRKELSANFVFRYPKIQMETKPGIGGELKVFCGPTTIHKFKFEAQESNGKMIQQLPSLSCNPAELKIAMRISTL